LPSARNEVSSTPVIVPPAAARSPIATAVGLYQRDVKIDFGVIQLDDNRISGYIEKPTYHYHVSMGVYVFERRAVSLIPRNERFDLPDLIQALVRSGEPVAGHHHLGYWLDIGRPDDYARAQDDFEQSRAQFLGS
jgi:NDP-sugar pyrophosphorylase family protein